MLLTVRSRGSTSLERLAMMGVVAEGRRGSDVGRELRPDVVSSDSRQLSRLP